MHHPILPSFLVVSVLSMVGCASVYPPKPPSTTSPRELRAPIEVKSVSLYLDGANGEAGTLGVQLTDSTGMNLLFCFDGRRGSGTHSRLFLGTDHPEELGGGELVPAGDPREQEVIAILKQWLDTHYSADRQAFLREQTHNTGLTPQDIRASHILQAKVLRRPTSELQGPLGEEWINTIGIRFRVVQPGQLILEAPLEGHLNQLSAREHFLRKQRGDPPLPPPIRRPARITHAYAISICEVTNAEFERVMGRSQGEQNEPEKPVAVSWEESAEFCLRLSKIPEEKAAGRVYRLPTQAEWQLARVAECYAWHLSDRHISVWNFCNDFYDSADYYRDLPEDTPTPDPKGPASGKSHVVMSAYSHPDPHRHVTTFRVVTPRWILRGSRTDGSR